LEEPINRHLKSIESGKLLAGVKTLQQQLDHRITDNGLPWGRVLRAVPLLRSACTYLILVPMFPLLGYYLLDQTGFSHWMVSHGLIPAKILGEGFGHVGLCFSIHYIFTAIRDLFRAFRLILS